MTRRVIETVSWSSVWITMMLGGSLLARLWAPARPWGVAVVVQTIVIPTSPAAAAANSSTARSRNRASPPAPRPGSLLAIGPRIRKSLRRLPSGHCTPYEREPGHVARLADSIAPRQPPTGAVQRATWSDAARMCTPDVKGLHQPGHEDQ